MLYKSQEIFNIIEFANTFAVEALWAEEQLKIFNNAFNNTRKLL